MASHHVGLRVAIVLGLLTGGLLGCNGEHLFGILSRDLRSFGGNCGDHYLDAVENTVTFSTDTLEPGEMTEIRLDVSYPNHLTEPILKSRRIVLTLEKEFTFLGFEALGQGKEIGRMDFDFSGDGTFDAVDYTIPFIATGQNTAFTDNKLNDLLDSGIDPTVVHSVGAGGELLFDFELPEGGANNGTPCHYFAFDGRYTLLSGLLKLPSAPGDYSVQIEATSVDPDTGDEDDQSGIAPSTFSKTVLVTVPEPASGLLALTALCALAVRRRTLN